MSDPFKDFLEELQRRRDELVRQIVGAYDRAARAKSRARELQETPRQP